MMDAVRTAATRVVVAAIIVRAIIELRCTTTLPAVDRQQAGAVSLMQRHTYCGWIANDSKGTFFHKAPKGVEPFWSFFICCCFEKSYLDREATAAFQTFYCLFYIAAWAKPVDAGESAAFRTEEGTAVEHHVMLFKEGAQLFVGHVQTTAVYPCQIGAFWIPHLQRRRWR